MSKKRVISKTELERFVRQNKPTKFIAGYFNVSERTIYRRIRKYGLKGIRPKGRKPRIEKIELPIRKDKWITARKHFDKLHERIYIYDIQRPRTKFINPKTLVCSNRKRNPKGKFTTVGIYWLALHSDVYFIYRTGIRYSEKPVSFTEIYSWARENAYDMLLTLMEATAIYVVSIEAYTFYTARNRKPNTHELS